MASLSAISFHKNPLFRTCLLSAALAGCALGPDFHPPSAPKVIDAQLPYGPMPVQTASAPVGQGVAQQVTLGKQVPALWWEMFQSPEINALVQEAMAHSPTVASAQAALRQAQALYEADEGNRRWPAIGASAGVSRQHASEVSSGVRGGRLYTLYNAGVNVSYSVDVFGAASRELEGFQAQVDYQRYQLEAAYLTLTANVVTTAIQEASLHSQFQATQDVIAAEQRSLAIVERQAEVGAVARQAVLQQRTQLAQTQAAIAPLEKALAQTRNLLAVYLGRLPGDESIPKLDLSKLALPVDLPLTVPSSLVRQRPDILASEALLHNASAQVGVATANLYPQLNLSASFGAQSLTTGALFSTPSQAWSAGASLLAPLFNGGALQARRRAAQAGYDQALAQYQQTVLAAFLNVSNSLRALDSDARTLQAQALATQLANESLDLVERQHQIGSVNVLTLLDAQRIAQQSRAALIQAQAARLADSVALFQALGGGWWARQQPATAQTPPAFADTTAPSDSGR